MKTKAEYEREREIQILSRRVTAEVMDVPCTQTFRPCLRCEADFSREIDFDFLVIWLKKRNLLPQATEALCKMLIQMHETSKVPVI